MVVKFDIRTDFRKRALKKAVDKANFNSLGAAGAFVRKVMFTSIRKRAKLVGPPKRTKSGKILENQKVSKPGQPPKSAGPDFKLRKSILFELSPQKDDVAIGPTFGGFGTIGKLHEEGGSVLAKQFKHVRTSRGRFTGQRIVSRKIRKKYPKRPFAEPALDKARPRLPRLWANSVKS